MQGIQLIVLAALAGIHALLAIMFGLHARKMSLWGFEGKARRWASATGIMAMGFYVFLAAFIVVIGQ